MTDSAPADGSPYLPAANASTDAILTYTSRPIFCSSFHFARSPFARFVHDRCVLQQQAPIAHGLEVAAVKIIRAEQDDARPYANSRTRCR